MFETEITEVLPSFAELVGRKRPLVLRGLYRGQPIDRIQDASSAIELLGNMPISIGAEYSSTYHPRSTKVPIAAYTTSLRHFLTRPGRMVCVEFPLPPMMSRLLEWPTYARQSGLDDVAAYVFAAHAGNYAHCHFDMDGRHVLLTQLVGRKRVFVAPTEKDSKFRPALSSHPGMSHRCIQNYTSDDRAKMFEDAGGWVATIEPGDTLFIPALFWHYVEYVDTGLSFNLRLGRNAYVTELMRDFDLAWPMQPELLQGLIQAFVDETEAAHHQKAFDDIVQARRRAKRGTHAELIDFAEVLFEAHARLCPGRDLGRGPRDILLPNPPLSIRQRLTSASVIRCTPGLELMQSLSNPLEYLVVLEKRVVDEIESRSRTRSILERSKLPIPIADLVCDLSPFEADSLVDLIQDLETRGWLEVLTERSRAAEAGVPHPILPDERVCLSPGARIREPNGLPASALAVYRLLKEQGAPQTLEALATALNRPRAEVEATCQTLESRGLILRTLLLLPTHTPLLVPGIKLGRRESTRYFVFFEGQQIADFPPPKGEEELFSQVVAALASNTQLFAAIEKLVPKQDTVEVLGWCQHLVDRGWVTVQRTGR